MLASQLASLPRGYRPDVAVIVVGGNDVTHRVPVAESVRHLVEAVEDLRARGTEVVVGTCPDLGALRPVPQPLRALGSRASRQLAEAQREAALARGARVVSLAHVVGPFFITNPEEMFSLDRFHPSAHGYKRTAKVHLSRGDVQPRSLPPERAPLQMHGEGVAGIVAVAIWRGAERELGSGAVRRSCSASRSSAT